MFKKLFVLLMLNSVAAFSGQYMAPSKEVQQRLYDLHKKASLSDINGGTTEEIGKLYACFFIEGKLSLPQGDDSVYINESERKLQILDPKDPRMLEIDGVMKSTLEKIKDSGSEFSEAAEECLKDLDSVNAIM